MLGATIKTWDVKIYWRNERGLLCEVGGHVVVQRLHHQVLVDG